MSACACWEHEASGLCIGAPPRRGIRVRANQGSSPDGSPTHRADSVLTLARKSPGCIPVRRAAEQETAVNRKEALRDGFTGKARARKA